MRRAILISLLLLSGVVLAIKVIGFPQLERFSCAKIGQDFLEYNRERYEISDYDSTVWRNAIKIETELVNLCNLDPSDDNALPNFAKNLESKSR